MEVSFETLFTEIRDQEEERLQESERTEDIKRIRPIASTDQSIMNYH